MVNFRHFRTKYIEKGHQNDKIIKKNASSPPRYMYV